MKKLTLAIFALFTSASFSMSQVYDFVMTEEQLEAFVKNQKDQTLGLPIGSNFPEFDYVDLDGTKIENDDLKDNLIVLNTWFVGWTGCKYEEEFLKKLTSDFKDRDDIVFLSFSMSSPKKIERYFSKRGDFGYKTASVSREWVNETFKITLSPTHYIIKDGILVE